MDPTCLVAVDEAEAGAGAGAGAEAGAGAGAGAGARAKTFAWTCLTSFLAEMEPEKTGGHAGREPLPGPKLFIKKTGVADDDADVFFLPSLPGVPSTFVNDKVRVGAITGTINPDPDPDPDPAPTPTLLNSKRGMANDLDVVVVVVVGAVAVVAPIVGTCGGGESDKIVELEQASLTNLTMSILSLVITGKFQYTVVDDNMSSSPHLVKPLLHSRVLETKDGDTNTYPCFKFKLELVDPPPRMHTINLCKSSQTYS